MEKMNKLKLSRRKNKGSNRKLVKIIRKDDYLKKESTVQPYKPVSKPRAPGDGPKIKIK